MIRFNQRVLCWGMNRSGKSEMARFLSSRIRVRRVLVDPKGEWALGVGQPRLELRGETVEAARAELDRLDPADPFQHVKPRWGHREQLIALFDWIDELPGELWVWIDEAYGVSTDSWAPPGLVNLAVAGAGRGRGLIACTQRPRNIAKVLVTEADHLFAFPPVDVEDVREILRGAAFVSVEEIVARMGELPAYGYVWINRRERSYAIGDPLPAHARTAAAGIDRAA